MSTMKTRTLGRGLEVSVLGLGCMGLSVNSASQWTSRPALP